jgi:hypothetical protein
VIILEYKLLINSKIFHLTCVVKREREISIK